MKKVIITIALVAVVISLQIAWAQSQEPRRGSELYRLRRRYSDLLREYKKLEIKMADMEKQHANIIMRYEWLCKCVGIDSSVVNDDSIWPAMQFDWPLSKGQKAFIKYPDYLTVYYVLDEKAAIMTFHRNRSAKKVWVTGIDTAGFRQDARKVFDIPFEIVGTRIYGGESLYVLTPTKMPQIGKKIKIL